MTPDPAELEDTLRKVREVEPTESIDPPTEGAQPQQAAVVVVKFKDDEGNIKTDIAIHGVEPTEVQTLLELGLRGWREKIGLPNV